MKKEKAVEIPAEWVRLLSGMKAAPGSIISSKNRNFVQVRLLSDDRSTLSAMADAGLLRAGLVYHHASTQMFYLTAKGRMVLRELGDVAPSANQD